LLIFFFSSRRRHTRFSRDWSSDVCSSDLWPRALSSCGQVLVRGARHPVLGRVCMDQFMVGIGDASAYNEDPVVLVGRQDGEQIRVEEVAAAAGTIPYEVLVQLNERIPREYRAGGAAPAAG